MLFFGKENVFMCLVAFQKIFRKIFSGIWKRRRKRQTQKNSDKTQKKNHQRSMLDWVRRRGALRAPVRRPRSEIVIDGAISRRQDRDRQRDLARSARTGARGSPAIIGLDWSSVFFLSRAHSLSLSFSGNTLKWKWKCKLISVVKAIFFRSTEINFRKILFSGPTKHPHFRKSISRSDFHPKQTHHCHSIYRKIKSCE